MVAGGPVEFRFSGGKGVAVLRHSRVDREGVSLRRAGGEISIKGSKARHLE